MIKMIERKLDLKACKKSLKKLSRFLKDNREIDETGSNGLQTFFLSNPDLILLMGDCFFPAMSPAAYQKEFSIIGEFRADFAISDAGKSKFLFVEFEDAKKNSVFVKKGKGKAQERYEWARRFEHGFSQVVDWHYRMDDLNRTAKFAEHFGSHDIDYDGILIIGRDEFIKNDGGMARLKWRKEKTNINNHRIHCLTFDMLLCELTGRFDAIDSIHKGNL
jgi:hypothetical protein